MREDSKNTAIYKMALGGCVIEPRIAHGNGGKRIFLKLLSSVKKTRGGQILLRLVSMQCEQKMCRACRCLSKRAHKAYIVAIAEINGNEMRVSLHA